MIHQFSKTNAESSDVSGHEQVGSTSSLAASLEHTVVHRPHFVGMVAEVSGASRVVKRKLSADEEAALMVACGERSTESGACFAVAHVGISEEYAGCGRESIGYLAGFTYKTVLHFDAVDDGRAITDDGVLADNAGSDEDIGVVVAENCTVAEP